MSYQALYRKYRPRTFDDVSGQAHITETLKRQVETGRLSHAYLFVGTRGTGKTTCAKILSRAVNCSNPEGGNPCNKCPACLGIEDGSVLDVLELDAASNNGVDSVRALREEAVYSPASVRRRVYIIDEVHMLSLAAFNALLKILEEPPPHLMFILATTELHKVPATILSRCQRFTFRRIPRGEIVKRLEQVAALEGMELTPDAAETLARLADGGLRDALSLLDQCSGGGVIDAKRVDGALGLPGNETTLRLLTAAVRGEALPAMDIFDALYREGRDSASLLGELTTLTRDALLYAYGSGALYSGAYGQGELKALCKEAGTIRLMRYMELLSDTARELAGSRSGNTRISVELCILRLCAEAGAPSIGAAPLVPEREGPSREPEPIKTEPPITGPPKDFWKTTLDAARPELPPHIVPVLENSALIKPALEGDTLTLYATSQFVEATAGTASVTSALARAATGALGRRTAVRVLPGAPPGEGGQGKLEALLKFGNVTIE